MRGAGENCNRAISRHAVSGNRGQGPDGEILLLERFADPTAATAVVGVLGAAFTVAGEKTDHGGSPASQLEKGFDDFFLAGTLQSDVLARCVLDDTRAVARNSELLCQSRRAVEVQKAIVESVGSGAELVQ